MKKIAIKGAVFFFIFAVMYVLISTLLMSKSYDAPANLNEKFSPYNLSNKITGFYEIEKETLDVVFLGSSYVHVNVNPLIMHNQYGIRGYDFTADQQDFQTSYYYAKSVFQRQKPQVLAVEIGIFTEKQTSVAGHYSFDFFPNTINKVEGVMNRESEENYREMLLPTYAYHSRWKELTNDDFRYFIADKEHRFMGHWAYLPSNPQVEEQMLNLDSTRELTEEEKESIDNMYALCVENNCQLVFFRAPSCIGNQCQATNNAIVEYIENEGYNIVFMDYSFENVGIDYNKDFVDIVHMNVYGAEKFSSAFGEFLLDYIEVSENAEADLLFEENYAYYMRLKTNYEFSQIIDQEEYLEAICQNEDYVAFIVGKSDPYVQGIHYNETINTDNSQWTYCALIDNGTYIYEEFGTERIEKEFIYGDMSFLLTSDAMSPKASVLLDHRDEKSNDLRGINVVVYDKQLESVIDTKTFDIYNPE